MTKQMWVGAALVAAVAWCWSASAQQPLPAEPASSLGSATLGTRQLVTHFQEQSNGPTVLTVVEPQTHVLAVYHIDRASGEVKLKSVRNFDFDLRLIDYNGGTPKPDEIRKMFELQQ